MDNSLIRKHNFDEAKNKIQRFSNNIPGYVYFDKVDVDGGLFGWGDHKVTGTEMNRFIGKVQDRLVSVNTRLRSIIEEFREVYNALDYLDKDYIQGIIASVEASEKATEEALKAQEDIRRTIDGLRQTVNALYNLKEDVDEIKSKSNLLDSLSVSFEKQITYVDYVYKEINKYYNNIDSIWQYVENGRVDISNLQQQVDSFIAKAEVENRRMKESIVSLQDYRSALESLVHLKDIDSIWQYVENGRVDISNLQQQIDSFIAKTEVENRRMEASIGSLQDYRSALELLVHLKDIDFIWNNVEKNNVDLSELHCQLNNFILNSHSAIDSLKNSLCNIEERTKISISEVDKKVKISYIIAGSSIALIFVQSILILLGVL